MRRFAIASFAFLSLALGFHFCAGTATAQGGNVVGIFGWGAGGGQGATDYAVTDAGWVYESADGGVSWTYLSGVSAIPGIVDICSVPDDIEEFGMAMGITASGDLWYAIYFPDSISEFGPIPGVGSGTDFRSIHCVPLVSQEGFGFRAVTACGDVYTTESMPFTWIYKGNIFGDGPSPTEHLDWGELKGEFRE